MQSMRYERQLFFKYIGKEGQEKIRKSTITIVGVGALGSVSAELLARAGIGKLILIDPDKVEIHNLQRQSLFDEGDVGKNKALTAKEKINKINSEVNVETHPIALDKSNTKLLKGIVLDGTDNMEVRLLMDDYCVLNKIHWIYGGIASSVGMIYSVLPGRTSFRDVFGNLSPGLTCEGEGVLNTIAFTVGSFQVTQALKYILGEDVEEDLIRINVWNPEIERIKVKKIVRKIEGKSEGVEIIEDLFVEKCKTKAAYRVRSKKQKKVDLSKAKETLDKVEVDTNVAVVGIIEGEGVIINKNEIMFKKCNDKEKMLRLGKIIFGMR